MRSRVRVRAGFVLAAALVALPLAACGDDGDSGGGDATPADVVVVGNDKLKFDEESYSALAGTLTIELLNDGTQPHTLLFEDDDVEFKKLSVAGDGDTDRESVTLTPGTYVVYCDIAGHRKSGMEATIVVD